MQIQQGYVYSPSPYNPPIGHPRLDIYLSSQQPLDLIDLKKARFSVFYKGDIKEIIITHPWQAVLDQSTLRVCPGRFRVWEQDDDIHYGLSLGGELIIANEDEYTHLTLKSSAPIFNLQEEINSPGMILASEVEALLAERQAAWGVDDEKYIQKLSQADPIKLFIAMIATIEQQQKQIPNNPRGNIYWSEEHTLHTIIKALDLAGQWPTRPAQLEELI